MSMPPRRITQHEIDSEACKYVSMSFDRTWEFRDLTGRDFGIDKIAERYDNSYATGELLLLQIKGTEKEINETDPKFSLETKTLIYAEMFSAPFLLIHCSISKPNNIYYLWLQEYIRVRLNYENPTWKNQEHNMVYFPKDNILGSAKSKGHLNYISKFPKFKDSWIEYYIALSDLCYEIPQIYCIETEPIFYCKNALNALVTKIKRKLEAAAIVTPNIPQQFIPSCMPATTKLCRDILASSSLPDSETIENLMTNCQTIERSVVTIAQRFNPGLLRIVYEVNGIADY